jgi:hypothetical protein
MHVYFDAIHAEDPKPEILHTQDMLLTSIKHFLTMCKMPLDLTDEEKQKPS